MDEKNSRLIIVFGERLRHYEKWSSDEDAERVKKVFVAVIYRPNWENPLWATLLIKLPEQNDDSRQQGQYFQTNFFFFWEIDLAIREEKKFLICGIFFPIVVVAARQSPPSFVVHHIVVFRLPFLRERIFDINFFPSLLVDSSVAQMFTKLSAGTFLLAHH